MTNGVRGLRCLCLRRRPLHCKVQRMATTHIRHQCPGGCGLDCPNKKVRPAPQGVSSYKQAGAPGLGRWVTVTVLAASNRGRNARGTTGAKRGYGPGTQPKGAKRAKRQDGSRMGRTPYVRTSNWSNV